MQRCEAGRACFCPELNEWIAGLTDQQAITFLMVMDVFGFEPTGIPN